MAAPKKRKLNAECSDNLDASIKDGTAAGGSSKRAFLPVLLLPVLLLALLVGRLRSTGGLAASPWLQRLLGTLLVAWLAFVVAACREALRVPRIAACGTRTEQIRTVLQIAGDLLLIPWYAFDTEVPVLGYQPTAQNAVLVDGCPTLKSFKQTPWLRSPYLGFVALMLGDLGNAPLFKKYIRREQVYAPDGGIIAMDWWEEEALSAGREIKAVVFIAATFVGDALGIVTRQMCRTLTARGFKCVVMVRRGCGLIMPNNQACIEDPSIAPSPPWCLTGLPDFKVALEHVSRTCPDLPLFGVGLSTGAWQMRVYLAEAGASSKLSAAVLLDAADDWETALYSLDQRSPLVTYALAGGATRTFKACGVTFGALQGEVATKTGWTPRPGGILALFRDTLAPAHGWSTVDDYFTKQVGKTTTEGIAVPTLELVSLKDGLMDISSARTIQDGYKASPHVITALTREGFHMMRWEGWRPDCWVRRTAVEFLETALQQQKQQ